MSASSRRTSGPDGQLNHVAVGVLTKGLDAQGLID
jgi:hypothetical protein